MSLPRHIVILRFHATSILQLQGHRGDYLIAANNDEVDVTVVGDRCVCLAAGATMSRDGSVKACGATITTHDTWYCKTTTICYCACTPSILPAAAYG